MSGLLIELRAQLMDGIVCPCVLPGNYWSQSASRGINTKQAMPEGIQSNGNDLLSVGACQVESLCDCLFHNGRQHLSIDRHLALDRSRERVGTLRNDIRDHPAPCIK